MTGAIRATPLSGDKRGGVEQTTVSGALSRAGHSQRSGEQWKKVRDGGQQERRELRTDPYPG